METEYYLVTVDIDSFGVYSLDQVQAAVQKALDKHVDLPNVFRVRVASVSHARKDNSVDGKLYHEEKE
jgi:hypothetical protein